MNVALFIWRNESERGFQFVCANGELRSSYKNLKVISADICFDWRIFFKTHRDSIIVGRAAAPYCKQKSAWLLVIEDGCSMLIPTSR